MRRALLLVALLLTSCLPAPTLPAPQVAIEPSQPDSADDLTLALDVLSTDGAGVTWQIAWELGEQPVADLDGALRVPAARTGNGDVWRARVRARLGEQVGPAGTASVIIAGPGDDDDSGVDPLAQDDDGDGFSENDGDCDDADPANFPGNTEVCDGTDNDCMGGADFHDEAIDADADGAPLCADCDDTDATSTLVADDGDCDGTPTADDCDDADATSTVVFEDNDCDGALDCVVGSLSEAPQGILLLGLCRSRFAMGCTPAQAANGACFADEDPVREVTLTRDYLLGEGEVTQGQWQAVMGNNPSAGTACGASCPVERVNWWEALIFANAVSTAQGLPGCYALTGCTNPVGDPVNECTGVTVNSGSGSVYDCEGYRLPTEAEWENAARAGTDLLYAGSDTAADVAWYSGNSTTVAAVQSKPANDWGLYDLSGNVQEWVWDWYQGSYFEVSPGSDPEGPEQSAVRGARGGHFGSTAQAVRVSQRGRSAPESRASTRGVRLARSSP